MQLTAEFIERIEEEYLKILIAQLQEGAITTDQAKEITREFLTLTPFASYEDMETKIQGFTTSHPEYGGIYVNLLKYGDEARTAALLSQMRSHLKNNKVDEALNLAEAHNAKTKTS